MPVQPNHSLKPSGPERAVAWLNAAFGFIAGYLYWKRGLECAVGVHMIAHITMIVGNSFV